MFASLSLRRLKSFTHPKPDYSLLSSKQFQAYHYNVDASMLGTSSDRRYSYQNGTIQDPEMDGLSLYEKKALLVNRELDSFGMGKYQWYIFFLCGFGYLLDLLYAHAFALIAPALQQELGFSTPELGNIFSAFGAGLCAGAFIWGVLVDIIGRRYAFNLTVLIAAVFGLCLAAPSNYNGILVLTALTGFGVGGNIPIDTTICLEFIPHNRRFLLALLSVFQPLGVVLASALAYALIPRYSCGNGLDGKPLSACTKVATGEACCTKASNMGWRYLLLIIGAICLAVFFMRFVVFRFQESPKFLLFRGHDERAVQVLHNIARFNKCESNVSMDIFAALTDDDSSSGRRAIDSLALGADTKEVKKPLARKVKVELRRYRELFSTAKMARLTILVWIIYIFDYWGFSIAGNLMPKILLEKNSAIEVSVTETYRNFIIIYTCGIPGVLLGACMYGVPVVGRKWAMVGSSALMGISLFLFATVNTEASNVALNAIEYFFQSMFNAVLYGWTPEAFPSSIRGTAAGIASSWGRLFAIVSPLIGAHLIPLSLDAPLFLAGAGVFVSTVAIILIPNSSMSAGNY